VQLALICDIRSNILLSVLALLGRLQGGHRAAARPLVTTADTDNPEVIKTDVYNSSAPESRQDCHVLSQTSTGYCDLEHAVRQNSMHQAGSASIIGHTCDRLLT